MAEPMGLEELFFGAMSGAAIVLTGALYALFFALGKLHRSRMLQAASWAAYGLLLVSTYVLVWALGLGGFWILVTSVMLLGYLLAPRAIWRLSVGTHAGADANAHDPRVPEIQSRAIS